MPYLSSFYDVLCICKLHCFRGFVYEIKWWRVKLRNNFTCVLSNYHNFDKTLVILFPYFTSIECVHDGHVGGPKQYNDFPVENIFYFYANIFYCFSPPTWPPCTHSIPFDYLLISCVTNYAHNRGRFRFVYTRRQITAHYSS